MLHRPNPFVGCLLAALASLLAGGLPLKAAASEIRFGDIEARMLATGPRAHIIQQAFTAAVAERDEALLWSNPALAYDHEEGRDAREWQVTLNKRFEQPFRQSAKRDGWESRVRSAELARDRDLAAHLADLKSGYVRLRLAEAYLGRLEHMAKVVDLAEDIADSRHAEGGLSGVDWQLIQVAVYAVDAAGRAVRRDQRQEAATWRAEMGLPVNAPVDLVTPVTFLPVNLSDPAVLAAGLEGRPANRSALELVSALDRQAEAARPSLVPGFEIFGGYKRFEDASDGFVAGAAVDLPLFGGNAGTSRRFTAERHMVDSARALDLAHTRGEVVALSLAVTEAEEALASIADRFQDVAPLSDTLLFAYREGSLTLDALLGGLQVEAEALDSYFAELAAYYDNIFRLEALTGVALMNFPE